MLRPAIAAVLLCLPISAVAQGAATPEFYIGFGASLNDSDSDYGTVLGSQPASDDATTLSGFAGARLPLSFGFIGAEVGLTQIETPETTVADLDYGNLLRARGMVGSGFGPLDVFVALGIAQLDGDGLGGFDGSGLTYGVGVEYDPVVLQVDGLSLRLEVMQDSIDLGDPADDGDASFDWDNTSIRAGAIFKF